MWLMFETKTERGLRSNKAERQAVKASRRGLMLVRSPTVTVGEGEVSLDMKWIVG